MESMADVEPALVGDYRADDLLGHAWIDCSTTTRFRVGCFPYVAAGAPGIRIRVRVGPR